MTNIKTKYSPKLIFIIVYLAYTSIYIARVNLSVATPVLDSEGIINTVQIGALGSAFSVIYACGRLINGAISDKKAPWFMITTGLIAVSISNILVGLFPPFIAIFLLWSTNAYAQSMLWSSVLCVVSDIYPEQEAKKKTSLMVTSVATGNIVAILLNTFLITKLGIAFAFVIPGIITLLLGGAVCIVAKDVVPPCEAKNHKSLFGLLKKRTILLLLVPALMHGVMKENITLWMVAYIVDTFNLHLEDSAYFVLFIPLIGFVGRLLYPVCYKALRENEHLVSAFGFGLCALSSGLLFLHAKNPIVAIVYLSIVYTAVSLINTSLLSIFPIQYQKSGNVASVSGIMDFATYLGGGIGSVIYGITISKFGYNPMFFSWVIISIISMLIVCYVIYRKREPFTTHSIG